MNTLLHKDALAETYEDVKRMIYKLVHRFSARYCMSFEDLIGEAHCSYIKAFETYKPETGTLISTWVYYRIWHDLTNYVKKENRYRGYEEINEEIAGFAPPVSELNDILEGLSEEARTIVRLTLDVPQDLQTLYKLNKARTPTKIRDCISEHLQDLGWAITQIETAYNEISQALKKTAIEEVPENGSQAT